MLDGPEESTFQTLNLFMQMIHTVHSDSLDWLLLADKRELKYKSPVQRNDTFFASQAFAEYDSTNALCLNG